MKKVIVLVFLSTFIFASVDSNNTCNSDTTELSIEELFSKTCKIEKTLNLELKNSSDNNSSFNKTDKSD